jgi:hypothetical protein
MRSTQALGEYIDGFMRFLLTRRSEPHSPRYSHDYVAGYPNGLEIKGERFK